MSDSDIFKAAVKLPADRRQEYLDQACGADHELRREVESLLHEHDASDSFLERPAAERIPTGAFDSAFGETVKDAEYALDFLAPSEKPDCLGKVGHYEIAEVVGRGGMGIVLKGCDPKLNRIVAVKVLAPELASNASARKRFLREGRAAAAVSHDHVVTIYGIDDAGTLPFIAMEYISGPSLEHRIRSEGTLELTEILRIGMQIASGLSAAHAQGLVHRDVKPANILLENGVEKVKITDFGLARAVDDVRMTKPGVVTGTPEYMSPEQARGESVDHRTDLFSLGSVMYAMCTGRSPFRAENTVAMIRRVCEDTPRPIEDVNPEIPDWLVQIIEELLAKSTTERFQSASELAELLGQCLAHLQEPSVNPLPDRLEGHQGARARRRRATTRRRGWLAAGAVLLVALGGLSLTEATGVTDVAGTVIRIVRGDGTLVIQVDDPEVSVSIDGEQLVITGAGPKEIRLGVGQHWVKGVKDGKPVHTELVTITRDGKRVVEVNAEPSAAAELASTPESEATAGVEFQEVWPFAGMDDLNVLAISRDGRYCAFTDPNSGDLMVRDLTTGEDRRLTEPTAGRSIIRASISPDNKWVAYAEHRGGEWSELRIVGIDGGEGRGLYANEEKSAIILRGWDPESQYLLATLHNNGDDVPANAPETVKTVRIVMVSVSDGSMRVLKKLATFNPTPRFSPDGRYVAYSREMDWDSYQEDIFLIPLDGGDEIHLFEHPADDDVLGWIPGTQGLLFVSDREGKGDDAWLIRVVDGEAEGVPRLVAKGISSNVWCRAQGPVRTPTGGWAFYYRESDQTVLKWFRGCLATLDPDTGKLTAPKPISQPTAGRELAHSPDFSRDGKYLAYYVAPAPEQSPKGPRFGPGNIVIRSLETGQEREITLSPKLSTGAGCGWGGAYLNWAPDGRSILIFGCTEAGRGGIYQVDTETGKVDPVVLDARTTSDWQLLGFGEVEGDSLFPGELSPDGKTLFFCRCHSDPNERSLTQLRIVARDLETGEEREIYRYPDGVFSFPTHAVSPDGERVFIASQTMLRVLTTAGGEPRELFTLEWEFERLWERTITWTPDSRYVLFDKLDQGRSELWRIAADGGQPERVGEFRATVGAYGRRLRVHPDGRQVAFDMWRSYRPGRIRMMQIAVSGELAKEMCTANLRRIGKAIKQYKNDHRGEPDWLSDLYPDYLQDPYLLRCPADHTGGTVPRRRRDPEMPCSYGYMFGPGTQFVWWKMPAALPVDFPAREGMTWKDARKLQLEYFGPVVPIVQCRHHSPRIFLAYDGDIYEAERGWEPSPRAGAGLLSQLKAAMKMEPGTWAQRYDMQRFLFLLRLGAGDEAALAELLETHLKEHPDDEAAREFLVELPGLRFCRDGSLEEVDDGSVELGPIDLELGEKVVGIWFPDISVPQGARIKRAYVQFTAQLERPASEKTDLVLHAELAPNADSCKKAKHNITSRRKTAASVKWSPEPWTVPNERSQRQRTPDLSSLIQEVVNQPDWQKGNALVLVISGSGRRRAQPHEDWSGAPMLYVEH